MSTKRLDKDFDTIGLDEQVSGEGSITDGSTADVEDDNDVDITKSGKVRKKRKVKKKVYFRSDFVGDGSSSDEDAGKTKAVVPGICDQNPAQLSWPKWCWYYVVVASFSTFHAAEFCGEKLADFFGITAPKYQYAINEYHRLKQEEREDEEREQRESECVRLRDLEKLSQLEVGAAFNPPQEVTITPNA